MSSPGGLGGPQDGLPDLVHPDTEGPPQETPPAGTTPPQASQPTEPNIQEFLTISGMDEQTAVAALQQAQQRNSPEGILAAETERTDLVKQGIDAQRTQIFADEFRNLLHTPHGQASMAAALAQTGHAAPVEQEPAPAPIMEGLVEDVDPQVKATLQAMNQQNQQLAAQMQQLTAQNQQLQQTQQQLQGEANRNGQIQYVAGELDKFVRGTPNSVPYQEHLAQDVYAAWRNNPQAFQSPGAVEKAATYFLQRYQAIANRGVAQQPAVPAGQVVQFQQPRVPMAAPASTGGGQGVVPAMPQPQTEDDAVQSVLDAMTQYRGSEQQGPGF